MEVGAGAEKGGGKGSAELANNWHVTEYQQPRFGAVLFITQVLNVPI